MRVIVTHSEYAFPFNENENDSPGMTGVMEAFSGEGKAPAGPPGICAQDRSSFRPE